MSTHQPRQPQGQPSGGQFSHKQKSSDELGHLYNDLSVDGNAELRYDLGSFLNRVPEVEGIADSAEARDLIRFGMRDDRIFEGACDLLAADIERSGADFSLHTLAGHVFDLTTESEESKSQASAQAEFDSHPDKSFLTDDSHQVEPTADEDN